MRRLTGWTNGRTFRPEGLEPRGLLAAGVLSGLNVVEELGQVSRDAAVHGVEVTAPITANGSVTFKFDAEAGGPYTLKVLYLGDGLSLQAQTPVGKAAIPTGPSGLTESLALALPSGSYAITASALGGKAGFVDWELLLNTGVGQAASQAAALVSTGASIPLTSMAGTTSTAPSSSTSAPVSNPSASAFSLATNGVGGLIGRSEPNEMISPVGPTTPEGSMSVAFAGDGLPAGVVASVAVPTEGSTKLDPSMLATLEMVNAKSDEKALAPTSWFEKFVAAQIPTPKVPTAEADEGSEAVEGDRDTAVARLDRTASESERREETGAAPELIAGAVVVAVIARRWAPKLKSVVKRPGFSSILAGWPISMLR